MLLTLMLRKRRELVMHLYQHHMPGSRSALTIFCTPLWPLLSMFTICITRRLNCQCSQDFYIACAEKLGKRNLRLQGATVFFNLLVTQGLVVELLYASFDL